MSVEIATAYVSLTTSARGIREAIEGELGGPLKKEAEKAGAAAGRNWYQGFDKETSKKLTDFGKKGMAATGLLTAGMFGAAKAAGSLEAAISANNQVLGRNAGEVQRWAKGSVEAVGLSERAALEAATSFGQLANVAQLTGTEVSGFSIEMVQLAADMAAYKDVSITEAVADLQSAFAGQTETIRDYGIFLDEASLKNAYFELTGERVSGTLTAQQRILATHHQALQDSTHLTGQAEREAGSLARAQDNLKAEFENAAAALGQELVPFMTDAIGAASDLFRWFGQLDEVTGGFAGKALLVGTGLLGVASAGSFVAGKIGGIAEFAGKAKNAMTTMGDNGKLKLNGLGLAAIGAAGAIAVIGINAQQNARDLETMNKIAAGLAAADPATAIGELGAALLMAELGGKSAAEGLREMAKAQLEGLKRTNDLITAKIVAGTATEAEIELHRKLVVAIMEEERSRAQAAATNLQYGDTVETAGEQTATAAGHIRTFAADTRAAQIAADALRRETRAQIQALKDLSSQIAGDTALLDLQDQFDEVRRLAEEAWVANATGADNAEKAVRDHERSVLDLQQGIIDYGTEIANLPPEQVTTMVADVDQGQLDFVENQLTTLARNRDVFLNIRPSTFNPGGSRTQFNARGTNAFGGGMSVTGEEGIEYSYHPKNTTIFSNTESGRVEHFINSRDLYDITGVRSAGRGGVEIGEVHLHDEADMQGFAAVLAMRLAS
jgi:hypothetical protein